MIGQVTPTPTCTRSVTVAIAPSRDHTNGLCPCAWIHGWKWSETVRKSKPTASARRARSTSSDGGCSSLLSVKP